MDNGKKDALDSAFDEFLNLLKAPENTKGIEFFSEKEYTAYDIDSARLQFRTAMFKNLQHPNMALDAGLKNNKKENYDVYYCGFCATKYKLGFGLTPKTGGEELAAGYCMICGVASPYLGYVKRNDSRLPEKVIYDKIINS